MRKKLAEFSILYSVTVTKVVVCYLLNKRMATFTTVPYCQQIALSPPATGSGKCSKLPQQGPGPSPGHFGTFWDLRNHVTTVR